MHRISLNNSVFEGSNTVYLLGNAPAENTTLIDTGVGEPSSREQLVEELEDAGVSVSEIDRVLLTHYHHDHAGLAGWLQERSGATVYVHEADAPLVGSDDSAWPDFRALQRKRFDEWGIPEHKRQELLEFIDGESCLRGPPAEVTTFEAADRFVAGDRVLEVVPLPGHSLGHSGFVSTDGTELFSGDALLPYYTPNVGGADVRVTASLRNYLETLRTIIAISGIIRAYPGHRNPIDEPAERAKEIVGHHRDRTKNVVSALDELGPMTAWEVSAHLFGELQDVHILHGPGEAYAHLEHLELNGIIEHGGRVFELKESAPDLDSLFPVKIE